MIKHPIVSVKSIEDLNQNISTIYAKTIYINPIFDTNDADSIYAPLQNNKVDRKLESPIKTM